VSGGSLVRGSLVLGLGVHLSGVQLPGVQLSGGSLVLSGVQRGCDSPRHPAWGASNEGVFLKKLQVKA